MRNIAVHKSKSKVIAEPVSDLAAQLDLVTEQTFANLRRATVATLRNERCRGNGPPFVKLGNKIFYRRAALADWVKVRTVMPSVAPTLISPRSQTRRAPRR